MTHGWLSILLVLAVAACAGAQTTSSSGELLRYAHDKDHSWGFDPAFANQAQWEKRADFLRHQVLVSQGLWPIPPKTPLDPVIHGLIDRDQYTIEKVFFASLPGHYVSGNLYRPKGRSGKLPAVLCPYGHWPDGRFIWKADAAVKKEMDSGAEINVDAARSPLQANCAMLARMGCIVFQYDMVGYCDSKMITHRQGFLDVEALLRLQSFMGLQTWNSIRSLDFVLSLPNVDPNRVAVTGSSSGGTQAIALGAVDPRPDTSFPMVMVSMNMQGGCVCENAPLYRVMTNNVELATLFAPKPEGMAAANDWTHDFMTRGLPEMKKIWGLYGVQEDVEGQHFDFGHNHNLHSRESQYNFLNRQLKLGWAQPVKEQPFAPVPPAQLSVYDKEHPLPADATDAAGVRKWMTHASQEQLADLAKQPDEYAKTIKIAWQAMVVDQLPASKDVEIVEGGDIDPSAVGSWQGSISRKGSGEHVRCKMMFGDPWNGTLVIVAGRGGAAGLSEADPAIGKLLAGGAAVAAIDLPNQLKPLTPATMAVAPSTKPVDPSAHYNGYQSGYERTIFADRVHDLLSLIALAKQVPGVKSLRLIASDQAGPPGLAARALAGDAIDRAAIDLNHFDFDLVLAPADAMFVPGAVKYDGMYGITRLCSSGRNMLCNVRENQKFTAAAKELAANGLTSSDGPASAEQMVEWTLK